MPPFSVSPSGPVREAEVGSMQTIQCVVSALSGAIFDPIAVSWTRPGGETVRNDSRLTVTTNFNGNNYTSSIQFAYLIQGDEGIYTCNVTSLSGVIGLQVEIDTLTSKLIVLYTYITNNQSTK